MAIPSCWASGKNEIYRSMQFLPGRLGPRAGNGCPHRFPTTFAGGRNRVNEIIPIDGQGTTLIACEQHPQTGDVRPTEEVTAMFHKIAPYARWVVHSHGAATKLGEQLATAWDYILIERLRVHVTANAPRSRKPDQTEKKDWVWFAEESDWPQRSSQLFATAAQVAERLARPDPAKISDNGGLSSRDSRHP